MNNAFIVIGLGYGDESKGATVDFLSKKTDSNLTIRFNGGPQAGHNVVNESGIHHTFSSYGSASFRNIQTLYTKDVLFNPYHINAEYECLFKKTDNIRKIIIHEECLVITPYHKILNKIRELSRGVNKHGSCGMGIGETMLQNINRPDLSIRAKDINYSTTELKNKLNRILDYCKSEIEKLPTQSDAKEIEELTNYLKTLNINVIAEDYNKLKSFLFDIHNEEGIINIIKNSKNPIFEGAQGVLLDQNFGFHPYTTWSSVEPSGIIKFLRNINFNKDKVYKIGCTRAYSTRHGEGPFPCFDIDMQNKLNDPNNPKNKWQGEMKFGKLDIQALKYAINVCNKIDYLSVSHLDDLNLLPSEYCFVSYAYKNILSNEDRTIKDLKPSSLEEQEMISNLLLNSHANCNKVHKSIILEYIENTLKTKILMTSNGPRADNRKFYL